MMGLPGRPRRVDTMPSFISPWGAMVLSSGSCMMTAFTAFTYCRALSSRPADCTELSPSLKARAPLACISYISASSLPSRLRDGANGHQLHGQGFGMLHDVLHERFGIHDRAGI